jgi:hypothetical protein
MSFNSTSQFGDVELRLHFDLTTRVVQIQGDQVDLGDNNVVLVDDVDVPGAMKVANLLRVEPEVPSTACHHFPRAGTCSGAVSTHGGEPLYGFRF